MTLDYMYVIIIQYTVIRIIHRYVDLRRFFSFTLIFAIIVRLLSLRLYFTR